MPFFRLAELEDRVVSPQYSTAHGPTVTGAKIEVGRYRYPPGTGATPHSHPNEQVIVVLRGRMRFRVGGDERVVGPGDAVLVPAGVLHGGTALDEEAEIVSAKDLVEGRGHA
jgi:quercetin dioxygenase-like cupin family protein